MIHLLGIYKKVYFLFLGCDKNIVPTIDIPLHKIIAIKDGHMVLFDIEKQ